MHKLGKLFRPRSLAAKDANTKFVAITLLPALMFWGLDAYFLRQERLFRKLYDDVRARSPENIDFSMNTQPYQAKVGSWFHVGLSKTLLAFHLPIVSIISIVSFVVFCH